MSATKLLQRSAASETDTHALAASLAAWCKPGDILLLEGDLGAGKTTFARGFIQAVAETQDDITSPTFTLVQTYPLRSGGQLWHYDLYRVKHASELQELGLDDALTHGITLIEWPDIARAGLPPHALTISIETAGALRIFTFSGGAEWNARLAPLQTRT